MIGSELKRALNVSVAAAKAAGALMASNFAREKKINETSAHDIKLELDVRCQKLIERKLAAAFPEISVLGEEGETGDAGAQHRWVIDPIDGTVNFAFGIPHACVCIALQERAGARPSAAKAKEQLAADGYRTLLGVVYDPFVDELWTATAGGVARLNGKPISVSKRRKLADAVVTIGFAKNTDTLNQMLPILNELVHRVMKIRIMGSAALALTYVASGRMDAYLEPGVRLWDIAAGGLILECAGGDFLHRSISGQYHAYRLAANNGLLRKQLLGVCKNW